MFTRLNTPAAQPIVKERLPPAIDLFGFAARSTTLGPISERSEAILNKQSPAAIAQQTMCHANSVTGGVSYRTNDTPSVKNQRFLLAPPRGGAEAPIGRCRPARGNTFHHLNNNLFYDHHECSALKSNCLLGKYIPRLLFLFPPKSEKTAQKSEKYLLFLCFRGILSSLKWK